MRAKTSAKSNQTHFSSNFCSPHYSKEKKTAGKMHASYDARLSPECGGEVEAARFGCLWLCGV
ncbi:predicted protein [Plenodomus lingam JN3]|uniref:Uncharacterized protein n=1 Tax=Leptosphaeria maculans (strain JN3 / isolate v23.1.3 / race Av1-4-5-6-7-8) TaxID=985895 RepID=E5A7J9_LEPMJ|nr:predicted protein [Plenodomus lingam JN3]CBX99594.1 predicted protein [Plenodomus lingam JN3]